MLFASICSQQARSPLFYVRRIEDCQGSTRTPLMPPLTARDAVASIAPGDSTSASAAAQSSESQVHTGWESFWHSTYGPYVGWSIFVFFCLIAAWRLCCWARRRHYRNKAGRRVVMQSMESHARMLKAGPGWTKELQQMEADRDEGWRRKYDCRNDEYQALTSHDDKIKALRDGLKDLKAADTSNMEGPEQRILQFVMHDIEEEQKKLELERKAARAQEKLETAAADVDADAEKEEQVAREERQQKQKDKRKNSDQQTKSKSHKPKRKQSSSRDARPAPKYAATV